MAPTFPHSYKLGSDFQAAVERAASWLQEGGVVGMPTESVYGLAVCADDPKAVARLCALKGREPHKPLPLIAESRAQVLSLCEAGSAMQQLMAALWPGPLTLGLRPKHAWPQDVLAPDGTLGIRVSAHPLLQALCARTGRMLTATSANLAGQAPAQSMATVPEALIAGVLWLDGGQAPGGLPSTVVVQSSPSTLRIARQGAVARGTIEQVVGAHVLEG